MKILLLGDYSNVHATLAAGLRALGHEVTLASDGDGWKGYARDIDLKRYGMNWRSTMAFLWRLWRAFRRFKGYDVVQLINPVFLPLRAERLRPFYRALRRRNGRIFLGAFGMDRYWVKAGLDCRTFRYSDFNLGTEVRHREDNDIWIAEWLNGTKGELNTWIAEDCDGIVSGLYEYDATYRPEFADKLRFIPFPIDVKHAPVITDFAKVAFPPERPVRFFVGVQRSRSSYKGTDIMLRALRRLEGERPDEVQVVAVENLPFDEYKRAMLSCDVLLDQLYSYTPAMNALQAMAQGLVVVGGGEPESYDLLGCADLRPIVNVLPDENDVYEKLRDLVDHKARIPQLSHESRLYTERYHDHLKVAQAYVDFWQSRKN
jgi:hypothetical protein